MMTSCEDKYDAIQRMLAEERHDEAISALEQLVTENDGHALAHYDLGNLYYASGRMDQGAGTFWKSCRT